jgi:hypothetical protein
MRLPVDDMSCSGNGEPPKGLGEYAEGRIACAHSSIVRFSRSANPFCSG